MNYNSKRLINPLKPICKCKTAEFNTLVDIINGSTSTKEYNKYIAVRKAIEELTSPCVTKESLTLAEIVKVIPYLANELVSIDCDVFDENAEVKHNGFFILVGEDNRVKYIASIFYDGHYRRNDPSNQAQIINNLQFPLTDKDIILIKESLIFSGVAGTDWDDEDKRRFNSNYSGTIYMYKLNGTD